MKQPRNMKKRKISRAEMRDHNCPLMTECSGAVGTHEAKEIPLGLFTHMPEW